MDLKVDLSFLNYRDEEDTARDAGVYWKYFSKKHHSPILDNMVEWAKVTGMVAEKNRKPRFCNLPEFKGKLMAEKLAEEKFIEKNYGKIYRGKQERKEAIEQWRDRRRREIQEQHDKAWTQKEKRDLEIKKIKEGYYWAHTKINRADYANFFLILNSPRKSIADQRMFENNCVCRAKTDQELFQDVLDAHYAESGDEVRSRRDAEAYVALNLGLEPLNMDVTAPATARGLKDEQFEELAYKREKVEAVKVLIKDKSDAELESEWKKETEVHFQKEKVKFLEKEWLEDLKPARLDESFDCEKPETFNVFQIMDAWVLKQSHFVRREEKEAIECAREVGETEFLSQRPPEVVERDEMLVQMEKWTLEDLQMAQEKFYQTFRDIENRHRVYCWLLTVDIVKDFLLKNKKELVLQPSYDVQETVTQVEIITFIYMNPELEKEKVEQYSDDFLNSWMRLKDSEGLNRDLADYTLLVVGDYYEAGLNLIREHYPLLGSWAKVRKMSQALMKMYSNYPPTFDFQTRMSLYF